MCVFFFKQKTAYEMRISDWSSDVCSSDLELVRASTVHMLRELGYDVLEASSAEHALAIMKAEPDIDVLVTDHLMPGTTGTDLIEQARVEIGRASCRERVCQEW